MNETVKPIYPGPITIWERFAFLFGRATILFAMFYIPLVFYTSTWRHYNVPKSLSLEFLMMILLACWAIIACGRRMVPSVISTPAAMLLMMALITTLVAVNLAEAWETVTFLIACMVLMIMVPKFFIRLKDFEVLAYLMGILCIVVDLYALSQWFNWTLIFHFTEPFGIERYTPKPVSFMGNENYTADFLNMTLPICLMLIFCHWRKPAQLIFFTFVSVLNFISMLYIDCNASYVGFMVSIPVVFSLLVYYKIIPWAIGSGLLTIKRETAERWFRHAIVVSILVVSVVGTYIASVPNPLRFKLNTMASWIDVDGDNVLDGIPPIVFRLQCMDATVRKIMDAPIFGIGPGNFKVIHPLYESQLERKVLGEETLARKAHNDHLYHAVEYGVFGLFAFYWLIGTAIYVCIRSLSLLRKHELTRFTSDTKISISEYEKNYFLFLQLGVLGAILTAVVSTAFSQTFVIASSATTYWLISGFAVAIFQALHRKFNGLEQPRCGSLTLPLTPIQKVTRHIPSPIRWLIAFLLVLPAGAFINYQLVGESWLRTGMIVKDMQTEAEGGAAKLPNKYLFMFKCFERAKHFYPYQMETFYILGRYYIDAITELDRFGKSGDRGQQRLQYLGLANLDRQKLINEGIVTLQTDIYMNPNYKWAHNNLGVLYDKMPNLTYSKQSYDRVFAIDYEQIFAHYNMGLGYMRHNDFESAVKSLEAALFVDPTKYEIFPFLSTSYIYLKDYERAIAAADRYLYTKLRLSLKSMRGEFSTIQLTPLAKKLNDRKLLDALVEAKRFTNINEPDLYRLYSNIAYDLLMRNEHLDIALDAVSKAEKSVPVPLTHELYNMYGAILYELGQNKEAAEKYEEFLRVQPGHVDVRRQLATIYTELGELGKALATYQPLMKKTPPNWKDQLTYFRLLITTGTPYEQAFPYFTKAVELGGDDAIQLIVSYDMDTDWGRALRQDPRVRTLLGSKFPQDTQIETQPDQLDTQPETQQQQEQPVVNEPVEDSQAVNKPAVNEPSPQLNNLDVEGLFKDFDDGN